VEAFNRILISRIDLPDFNPGIEVFEEKDDLLPFEEAKLYGHNATHALLGYLLWQGGCEYVDDAGDDTELLHTVRQAFLVESGGALCRKYAGADELFTREGFRDYADDLLERMVNPYLRDSVRRVTRNPRRKLGWNDRLVGTMRLAREQGIQPRRYATGAAAALACLQEEKPGDPRERLEEIWSEQNAPAGERAELASLILSASGTASG
jgi:mannitol-1-phosphate 5-dehydrogenase